jgi:hypothetical protein
MSRTGRPIAHDETPASRLRVIKTILIAVRSRILLLIRRQQFPITRRLAPTRSFNVSFLAAFPNSPPYADLKVLIL